MTVCYFTATGNSLYVARRISGELLSIPELMKKNELSIADDAVGIVCPVYAGQMPKMVHRFLEKASIKTDYFFFIYTFGMSDSVARPNAEVIAKKAGLDLKYINSIKMVDNYLPGFEMQNQKDTAGAKKIEEHIDEICRDIKERKEKTVPVGAATKAEMAVIRNTMEKMIMKETAAQNYIVDDNRCVKCGICAKVCPADNITVTDHVEFSNHCEVCYACLHNCPQNAIHLKNEKSSVRFRNEHVSLKDIIASNQ